MFGLFKSDKKLTYDKSWHIGIYPYSDSDKKYTFDELVIGEKYILVEAKKREFSGKSFRYKSVVLLEKHKTDKWYCHNRTVKIRSTFNDVVFSHQISDAKGIYMYQWRDIDADRKK